MTVDPNIDPARMLEEHLAQASPDMLRELLGSFINTLLSAEADAVCGAEYGVASPERTNRRNGYRHRDFDTRAGTIDVAIPKLREGSYFPDWLLERRKRAESALISVWSPSPICSVSVPGGWRTWSSSWASPGSASRRCQRWPRISTLRWRRSAAGR